MELECACKELYFAGTLLNPAMCKMKESDNNGGSGDFRCLWKVRSGIGLPSACC